MLGRLLSYLLIVLVIRALFYSFRIRRTLIAYGLKAIIEIGFFLLLYDVSLLTGLTAPGLIILLNIFLYVFEIQVVELPENSRIRFFGPAVVAGLILYTAAFALFLSSDSAPVLQEPFKDLLSAKTLTLITVGFVATFEIGHFVDGARGAGERLLVYLFAAQGLFLPAAVVILAKGIIVVFQKPVTITPATGAGNITGGIQVGLFFVGPALSVLSGIVARALI